MFFIYLMIAMGAGCMGFLFACIVSSSHPKDYPGLYKLSPKHTFILFIGVLTLTSIITLSSVTAIGAAVVTDTEEKVKELTEELKEKDEIIQSFMKAVKVKAEAN